jgi:hypothetical protein
MGGAFIPPLLVSVVLVLRPLPSIGFPRSDWSDRFSPPRENCRAPYIRHLDLASFLG